MLRKYVHVLLNKETKLMINTGY